MRSAYIPSLALRLLFSRFIVSFSSIAFLFFVPPNGYPLRSSTTHIISLHITRYTCLYQANHPRRHHAHEHSLPSRCCRQLLLRSSMVYLCFCSSSLHSSRASGCQGWRELAVAMLEDEDEDVARRGQRCLRRVALLEEDGIV